MQRPTIVSLCLAATLAAAPAWAAAPLPTYTVQPDKSRLAFTYRQMNVPLDGRFARFAARVVFDPARLAESSARIDLDVAGIDAGSPEANDAVVGKAWFDAKTYPQARFVSTRVTALGGNRYEARGTLTIKGRTREVAAPFSFAPQPGGAVFDGAFEIKRADFAIGEGEWADFATVANEIRIQFHFQAQAAK